MTRIPEHTLSEIRDKTDIVKVVGAYVDLRRSGSSHKGLCPFHAEKTPSFYVSEPRQSFYCFGCDEKGDVFGFLMKIEGRDFLDVVRDLAERSGVRLPERRLSDGEKREHSEREKCLRVNRLAADFFRARYQEQGGRAAREYVESRGLGAEVVERFELGYAPDSWDGLTRHLGKHKVPTALAVKLGLCALRRGREERAGGVVSPQSHYDFFRDRLIFPILASNAKVLGFSGRLLDPEAKERKYVNSPETPVYKKSELLYGFHAARTAMRKASRAILVEGNVDVLALHQAGYPETVAPLGTALTEKQLQLLRRQVGALVLGYDGDKAGQAAAQKAAQLVGAGDLICRVASLPAGKDPADLAISAPEELARAIDSARPGPVFIIEERARVAGQSVEERVRELEGVLPLLRKLENPVVREEYTLKAASAFRLEPRQVERLLRGQSVAPEAPKTASVRRQRWADFSDEAKRTLTLLALLVKHPELAPVAERHGVVSYLEDEVMLPLVREAIGMQAESGRVLPPRLLDLVAEEIRPIVAKVLMSDSSPDDEDAANRHLLDIIASLRLPRLTREIEELARQAVEAGQRGEDTEKRALIERMMSLSRERESLKNSASGWLGTAGMSPPEDMQPTAP